MATRPCRICGRVCPPGQWRRGRCPRCAVYWRTHGVERPPDPRPAAAGALRRCTHCGQPTRRWTRGSCSACYEYWRRTGRERPPELWQH